MGKLNNNQKGFSAIETVLILVIVAIVGFVGWFVYHSNQKAASTLNAATQTSNSTPKFGSKKSVVKSKTVTHTAQEAVSFTQTTYDDYLAALNKANAGTTHTQPVAQAGLAAVKTNLAPDLYAKAAAVTQATPFSCTAQYVTDKYTASLASSDKTSAKVAVAISNGSGLSTKGMSVSVDLASLKITAVSCPN